jgi:Domain of unknown function (DUF4124)
VERGKIKVRTLMGLMILLLPVTALPAIYKWVDANGKVHYSDKKEATTKPTIIKAQPETSQEESDRARQRYEKIKQDSEFKKAEQQKEEKREKVKEDKKRLLCPSLLSAMERGKRARTLCTWTYSKPGHECEEFNDETRREYLERQQERYDQNCL